MMRNAWAHNGCNAAGACRLLLALCACLVAFDAQTMDLQEEQPGFVTARHQAMGTEFVFTLWPPSPEMGLDDVRRVAELAFEMIDGLERRISNWIPESHISRINQFAGHRPVETTQEMIALLLTCRHFHRESGGAFDVTVGPLLDLWGFYRNEGVIPDNAAIEEALAKVGMDKVEIDEEKQRVRFATPDMRIDFGGIGKGLALDRAAYILREQGVKSAILHGGTSTVVVIGTPPDGSDWKVRVRSPYNDINKHLDEVVIRNESLSTSSGSEKFFELEGRRYCHIFDPRTGRPVEGVLSVTVIAPTGVESDALSTAFFVMGLEQTKAYCRAHPGIRAVFVVSDAGALKPVRVNFPGEEERS